MGAQDCFLPCPPHEDNLCRCGNGNGTCGKMKYIQPPRPKSFKPEWKYIKPTCSIDANTVYKNSYYGSDADEIKMCRMKPYLPINSLQVSPCKIDNKTITSLSYPGYTQYCKRGSIYPHARSMLGTGPMQNCTTQKHDFVTKPVCKRELIIPDGHIKCNDIPLENETVQKLSFMSPDLSNFSAAESCRPLYKYKRPDIPMEADTIQKLSYLPVRPPMKEDFPWAKKNRIPVLDVPIEENTTYKLSYVSNGGEHKPNLLRTMDNRNLVTSSEKFEDDTVYKGSFLRPGGCYKRSPILPNVQIQNSTAKINPHSMYSLSYPGYSEVQKRCPILPHSRYLLGSGPLDDLTIQKRDFVSKPWCRRSLIIPPGKMEKLEAPFEKATTTKLSFMTPPYVEQSASCRPKDGVVPSSGSIDDMTIQKLSYGPVIPLVKEEYPWAKKKNHNSEEQMDFKTIQHLSFLPPGETIPNACNCKYSRECMNDAYPKADCFDV